MARARVIAWHLRMEGKAKAVVEVRSGGGLDVLISNTQERICSQLGYEPTREEVIEQIRAYRPELVEGYDG